MKIGFTSTGELTDKQLIQVHMLLGDLQTAGATHAAHTFTTGGDAAFHEQATGFGYDVSNTTLLDADMVIVAPDEADPVRFNEPLYRLVCYAREAGKPLCILWPDGTTKVEGVEGVRTATEWRLAVQP